MYKVSAQIHPNERLARRASGYGRAMDGSIEPDEPTPDETDRPDPRVSTVPLDTEDGGTVVIQQQNAGPGQQVGGGEFKRPGDTSFQKQPDEAAAEQHQLEREAPTHAEHSGDTA